jgi:hypothetical protein
MIANKTQSFKTSFTGAFAHQPKVNSINLSSAGKGEDQKVMSIQSPKSTHASVPLSEILRTSNQLLSLKFDHLRPD